MTRRRPAPMQKLFNILLTSALVSATSLATAAPVAYSINSDGPDSLTHDSLYRIDLATGQIAWRERGFEKVSILGANTVIGSDGFGFVNVGRCHHKIPQVGAVRIGKVEKKGRQNRRVNIHLDD